MTHQNDAPSTRIDLMLIASLVDEGSRVLDVGCGNGELLELLAQRRHVDGRGVELSQTGVNACVARGLSVVQGDADQDLADYPDNAFDYVILSQTIQAVQHPRLVLDQLMRIGRKAIVSLPNFGHWKVRLQLALGGRMPVTGTLPLAWYETPNIHLCTVRDFVDLCSSMGLVIDQALTLDASGQMRHHRSPGRFANLFAEQAVFLLSRP